MGQGSRKCWPKHINTEQILTDGLTVQLCVHVRERERETCLCVWCTAMSSYGLRWGRGGISAVYQEVREISRGLSAVLFKALSTGVGFYPATNPTHPTSQSARWQPNLVPRKAGGRSPMTPPDGFYREHLGQTIA